jgi:hypothetical protein
MGPRRGHLVGDGGVAYIDVIDVNESAHTWRLIEDAFVGAIDPEPVLEPFWLFRMEAMQSLLALIFAGLLLIVVVWSFANTYGGDAWQRTKELLDILLPAITALLGSAVGFYFGTHSGFQYGDPHRMMRTYGLTEEFTQPLAHTGRVCGSISTQCAVVAKTNSMTVRATT